MRNLFRLLFFAYVAVSSAIFAGWAVYLCVVVAGQPTQFFLSVVFLAITLIMGTLNVAMGYFYYQSAMEPKNDRGCKPPKALPKVAVAVACCNEEPGIVRATVESMARMDYPKGKVSFWLLDSSEKQQVRQALEKIAKENGFSYLYRDRHAGFKAGSLNAFVSKAKDAEFVAVFDADEQLVDGKFLIDNVGFFSDEKLAFIQTNKAARPDGIFANAVEATYALFYRTSQPIRSRLGMALYSGSVGIIRTSALREVGGFCEDASCPSEDAEFALKCDIAGLRGMFVARTYAYGEPIRSYSAFRRQQWKYTYGSARIVPKYLSNAAKLGRSPLKHLLYVSQLISFPYTSILVLLSALFSASFVLSNLSFTLVSFSELFSIVNSSPSVFNGLQTFGANVASLVVISCVYFGAITTGVIAGLLNLSLSVVRSEAALSASTRPINEIAVTQKTKRPAGSLFGAISLTWMDFTYALLFIGLTVFSLMRGDVIGAVWMSWYAFMFLLAPIFALIAG
ncbi:MAG: glycosyltransferase [Candidatus Micrarchaeia archaeon]